MWTFIVAVVQRSYSPMFRKTTAGRVTFRSGNSPRPSSPAASSCTELAYGCWKRMASSSTVKARNHGFHAAMDTESMFIEQLARLRRERVIP